MRISRYFILKAKVMPGQSPHRQYGLGRRKNTQGNMDRSRRKLAAIMLLRYKRFHDFRFT